MKIIIVIDGTGMGSFIECWFVNTVYLITKHFPLFGPLLESLIESFDFDPF